MTVKTFFFYQVSLNILLFSCICAQIIDLSSDCKNNLHVDYFLTYGMGFIDGTVVTLNSISKNCTIHFHSEEKVSNHKMLQIIVLENMKNLTTNETRTNFTNDRIKVLENQQNVIAVGNQLTTQGLYVGAFSEKRISVEIRGESPSIKITATAAKVFKEQTCLEDETKCRISNYLVCINRELLCDGNLNCGSNKLYDEAETLCQQEKQTKYILLITTSCFISAFAIAAFARLLYKILPKIPKAFFYITNRDNKLLLSRPIKTVSLSNRRINATQAKSTRVLFMHRQKNDNVDDIEVELQSHFYATGKSYQSNPNKRLTTNSPIIERPRKDQYVKETFGREIIFLSDGEGNRHKLKKDTTTVFSN